LHELERDRAAPDSETVIRGRERSAIHSLTGKPPQRDRIGRWRQEMTATDRRRFEEVAGEMLRELGYDTG
jgi:hypothetical protein